VQAGSLVIWTLIYIYIVVLRKPVLFQESPARETGKKEKRKALS